MSADVPAPPLSSGPASATRRGVPPWLPILVVAVAWLAHGGALQGTWVLDDTAVVRDNRIVQHGPGTLPEAFRPSAWGGESEPEAWRPIALVSFALEAPLWRADDGTLSPLGFHLTNLFLHGLAAVLLLAVLVRLAPDRPVLVGGAALVFAAHPLHVGTVGPLVARADLLCLVFCLAAARLWLAVVDGKLVWLPWAALAWLLALLSNEAAIGLPLALGVLHLTDRRRRDASDRPAASSWAPYLVLVVPLAIWLVLRPAAVAAPDLGERLLLGLEGVWRSLSGLLVPVGILSDRLVSTAGTAGTIQVSPLGAALGGLVLLAAGASCVRALAGRPVGVLGLSLILVLCMAPLAALVQPDGAPCETRFAYVAAIGLFPLVGLLAEGLAFGRRRIACLGVGLALLLAGLSTLSWCEAAAWENDDAYHAALLDRHPRSIPLMRRLVQRHRAEAEAARLRSSGLPARDPDRVRQVYAFRRHLAEAETTIRQALRLGNWQDWTLHFELGAVLQQRGSVAEALQSYDQALLLHPWRDVPLDVADQIPQADRLGLADLHHRMGLAQEGLGEQVQALDHHRYASLLSPDDPVIQGRTGLSLLRARQYAESLRHLRRAIELAEDPDRREQFEKHYKDARSAAETQGARHMRAGRRAEQSGDQRGAADAYEAALESDPHRVEAYLGAARLRGLFFGNYARAEGLLRRIEAILVESGREPGDRNLDDVRDLITKLRRQKADEERREREEG